MNVRGGYREASGLLNIYVDADACPVKSEVYRVADRHRMQVTVVANSRMRIPKQGMVVLKVVAEGPDAADNWIADHAEAGDIVVTADIPLAGRCIEKGARVIGPMGKPFTEDNIGAALAGRALMADLRSAGEVTPGPPPLKKRDRSRFLQALENGVQAIRREYSGHLP